MVTTKKGKKDFMSGLDMIIQKTTAAVAEPEGEPEVEEMKGEKEVNEVKEIKEVKEVKDGVEKERPLTIKIPAGLKRDIKKYCAANEISIKELFIRSVSGYMGAEKN